MSSQYKANSNVSIRWDEWDVHVEFEVIYGESVRGLFLSEWVIGLEKACYLIELVGDKGYYEYGIRLVGRWFHIYASRCTSEYGYK